jgi:hypothetical protein
MKSFIICRYSSPNIIKMIKSRKIRWAGNVMCMGEKRNAYKILAEKSEGKISLGRPRKDEIKTDERMWTGFIWLGIGSSGGLL